MKKRGEVGEGNIQITYWNVTWKLFHQLDPHFSKINFRISQKTPEVGEGNFQITYTPGKLHNKPHRKLCTLPFVQLAQHVSTLFHIKSTLHTFSHIKIKKNIKVNLKFNKNLIKNLIKNKIKKIYKSEFIMY